MLLTLNKSSLHSVSSSSCQLLPGLRMSVNEEKKSHNFPRVLLSQNMNFHIQDTRLILEICSEAQLSFQLWLAACLMSGS